MTERKRSAGEEFTAKVGNDADTPAVSRRIGKDGGGHPLDLDLASRLKNDVGNAERLLTRSGNDLVMVRELGWHAWTGQRWSLEQGLVRSQVLAQEATIRIFDEADALARHLQKEGVDEKIAKKRVGELREWAVASGSSTRISAMLREAGPHLTVGPKAMDRDPYLFNVANGTMLLQKRGGDPEKVKRRPHERLDRITKMSPVAYDRKATSTQWQAFLDRVLPKPEVQVFLQRWFGYILTGDTSEQVLVLLHGRGANGKSTLIDVLNYVFGDYALTLPFASLLHDDRRRGSEATPDIARLPGARFVVAAEPELGARFSESLLKSMTGGEAMIARHLNKGFFEFDPQFKLTLSFNARPQVRGQDEGIWRRLLLVPFEVIIPREERDPHLTAKLKADAPAVLNWLLDGHRLWVESGLAIPDEVRSATSKYREESDPLGQFLNIATDRREGRKEQAKVMYDAYVAWCKDNAAAPVTMTLFGRLMTERGYEKTKDGVMFYLGVTIKPEFVRQPSHAGEPPPPSSEDYET